MSHPYPRPASRPLFAVAASSFWERLGQARSAAPRRRNRRLSARLANPVELLAGAGDFRLIADRPGAKRGNRNQQIAAERGQRIIHPRRNGRKRRSCNQPVALEPAQRKRQHALRNAADRAPQLVEAHRPVAQPRHDQDRPFVADPGEHVADRPAIRGQMNVAWFHRCAFLRDFVIGTYLV